MALADDLDAMGRGALLISHLHHLAVFLLRLDQHHPLGGIVAAGLLYVDVFPRLQPGNRHRCVPKVGSRNADGIYILLFENFAEVFFGDRGGSHRLSGFPGKLRHGVAIDVAYVSEGRGLFVSLKR